MKFLNTNLTSVINQLAPVKAVRPVKGDSWLDGGMIDLRRETDTALRCFLSARAFKSHSDMNTKLQKEFETPHNEFNACSMLARDFFTNT